MRQHSRGMANLRRQVNVPDVSCAACGEVKSLTGRGLCSKCWQRARKAGALAQYGRARRTFAESYALAQSNETDSGCWPWPTVAVTGYPTAMKLDGRSQAAHHVAWVLVNGPVPVGMTIDHRCHTDDATCQGGRSDPHRRCVRPDHLQLASNTEQQRLKHKFRAPHCRNGHPRNAINVRMTTKRTKDGKSHVYRTCRVCAHEADLRQRRKRGKAA